ncbi:MAG: hypothetical protein HKN33_17855 [Pyrinomonadaceae bacterium]|nr:hypothetical protein [Pyrinomonadaceae bacterium]
MINRLAAILIVLLVLILTGGTVAQSPKKVLSKATKALGKKKLVKNLKSWKKSGLIIRESDGVSGDFLSQATKPGLYNSQFDIAGFEYEVGFNGRSGWVRDSRSGLKTYTGKEGDDFRAEADFRNWTWVGYKKIKSKAFPAEATVIDGKQVKGVRIVSAKGIPIKLYFDPVSYLLLREEVSAGEGLKVFEYSDYRPVNGILEPFTMKMTLDGVAYNVKFDRILHNPLIEQSEFDFPRISNRPLPDIPKLLEDLQANQEKLETILEDYSYKQQSIKREISKSGKVVVTETETVQLSFYEGFRIQRVIAKNGKPLSPKEQAKADKQAQKRVREIEKKLAKQDKEFQQSSSGTPSDRGGRISIAEVLKASRLVNPRRERLKGRDVVVFDFEPNPDFDFKNAKSFLKFFGKTIGVMWIDEKDKQVARVEAVLADSYKVGGGLLAKLRKGASFTLEQERVNDEIWLPTVADINLSIRVLLFGGVKVNQVVRSFDYEKFRTEVREAKVGDVVTDQ